jgi:4-hydroxy-3-polyprenylbenzoate decarboxylase
MSFKNLKEFISALEKAGELKRVKAEVDPYLEITEIADRMSKTNGPAILFEKTKGSHFPLLINAFGSFKRMEMALNSPSLDDIGKRIETLIKMQPPSGLFEKIKLLLTLKEIADFIPKKIKHGPCQERIFDSQSDLLDMLPILTCWPSDGGPFITLPIVITKDPETAIQNLGMYRMHKYDKATTGMHWQYNKDGTRHFDKYKNIGKRMEVAVALGGSPAVTYAASAPLPPDIDELMLAGFLNSGPIETVKGQTVDLYVPAESDFIIEGYVDPNEERLEGPFGDHTGFYSAADMFPVFHVTASHAGMMLSIRQPWCKPPMEDCYMAKATERIFLPIIKMILPEIKDIELPIEGVFHNCALVSIDKRYPGQAKKVINALWGLGQFTSTKFIAVFDRDIDLRDSATVLWKLLNNVDPGRDLLFSQGPLDALDHSASYANFGGKMGIDATRKTREEGMGRDWPEEIVMSDNIKALVNKRWKEYGF